MDFTGLLACLIFIMAFAEYLDKTDIIYRNKISGLLENFPNMDFSEIVKWSNSTFNRLYERIYYCNRNQKLNNIIWMWIIFSFLMSFLSQFIIPAFRIRPPLEAILIFSLISSTIFVFITQLNYIIDNKPEWTIEGWAKNQIVFIIFIIFFIIYILLFYYLFEQYELINTFNISLPPILIAILFGLFILIGYCTYITIIIHIISKKFPTFLSTNLSPIRTIISSIIFLSLVIWIKRDVAQTFLLDFNEIGIILIAYLFLNIFADSISIWETGRILQISETVSSYRMFGLLVLDFLFSASIFLLVPLTTGNFPVFVSSIWFKGDSPWLGILFWSTFFTSLIFWIYISSIFLLKLMQNITMQINKLEAILPIKSNPIRSLGLIAMVPITIIFLIFS